MENSLYRGLIKRNARHKTYYTNLDDWLTVQHRSITLVNFQLDAQNSYLFIYIYIYIIHLLKFSTCFEHGTAHLQEVYVVMTIPEAVYIQLRRRPPEDE